MKLLKEDLQEKGKKNFINLINEKELINDFHYEKTINLWGKNNHKKIYQSLQNIMINNYSKVFQVFYI